MRKMILIVCGLLITAASAFADVRLNSRGERMVSKLYTINCDGDIVTLLEFLYDNNDEINGVKAYEKEISSTKLVPYFTIYYQKGCIKRTDYWAGEPIKNRAYEYEFNEYGQLVAKSMLEWGEGVTVKDTETYQYADNYITSGEHHTYYAKASGSFYLPEEDDSMFHGRIYWLEDDNVYPAYLMYIRDDNVPGGLRIDDSTVKVPPVWDSELPNNINIELAAMFLQYNMYGSGFGEEIEFITRWLPVYSQNLLKEYGHRANVRKLIYSFDEDGYPIEIVDTRKYESGNINNHTYRIEYVD